MESQLIPLDKVVFNPFQARTIFDEEEISNLAASFDANGQLIPIGVYKHKDTYIVHDGDRRVRAARKLGWKTIRAEINDVLASLDPKDPKVLEMREKADQANNQRSDITTMERARSRFALFKDGVSAGRYLTYGKPSVYAFAKYLGSNESTVSEQIHSATEEEHIKKTLGIAQNLTEDTKHYKSTASLRNDPVIRRDLIELTVSKQISSPQHLLAASKAIESAPEAKDIIIAEIKKGTDPKSLREASELTIGLEPEIRKPLIALRSSEHIRKDELPQMAQVLKDTPELANYALDLKKRGESVADIKRTIDQVKVKPESQRQQFIEAGVIFKEDPNAFKIEIPEPQKAKLTGQLAEIIKSQEDREKDPAFIRAKKLRENWESHMALLLAASGATCPKCGKGKLIWDCCKLDLDKSKQIAKENFEKRN